MSIIVFIATTEPLWSIRFRGLLWCGSTFTVGIVHILFKDNVHKQQEIFGSFSVPTHSLVSAPKLMVESHLSEKDFQGLTYTLFENVGH